MPLEVEKTVKRQFVQVKFQFLAAICANLISFAHGVALGWLSPVMPLLRSENDSPLGRQISLEEASWIGAIICMGGVTGNVLFSFISNRFGRKKGLVFLAIPNMAFWITVYLATDVWHLYMARFMAGMTGGGVFVCIPLYVAEIASDYIRGTLGSLLLLSCNIGILCGYLNGAYLSYHTIPCVSVTLPIIFILGFVFFPETPQFLLMKERFMEAEESLKFYRNCRDDTKIGCREIHEEFEKLKQIAVDRITSNEKLEFKDITAPAARKGLLIGFFLVALNQFSGMFALVNYTASIFEESGSILSVHMSSITIGIIQIVGTYAATVLVDKVGRRVLLLTSCTGTIIGLTAISTYSYLKTVGADVSNFTWVPVTSLSFVILIASIGVLPLSYVVVAEVLPRKVRSIGVTLCMVFISCLAFLILKTFPIMMAVIKLYGCMAIFASVSFCGLIFIYFCIPETKGKNLDVIETKEGLVNA